MMPDVREGLLSAMEVDAMDEKKYKWFVFDMLQKGNKKMGAYHKEIKSQGESIKGVQQNHCELQDAFAEHIEDRQAHPFGITLKEKVWNRQNGILGFIITIFGGIIWYVLDKLLM